MYHAGVLRYVHIYGSDHYVAFLTKRSQYAAVTSVIVIRELSNETIKK